MKRFIPAFLALFAALFFATSILSAQVQPTTVVFVDSQAAIRAHPSGERAAELEAQAKAELDELRAALAPLVAKAQAGQQLTPEEREQADTFSRSYDASQRNWTRQIEEVAAPAIADVNDAIDALAQENGYSIVLDSNVAGPGGVNLVIYADQGLNITEQVIERIR